MRAVCDRGLDVDSILVITYTRRAAGELRTRIRAALAERGRHDLARELDGAWISTIHGFCLRLLKGVSVRRRARPALPRARRRAGGGAPQRGVRAGARRVLRGERPERLQLLATYGADGLRRMLTGVYETLRSAGRELDLDVAERPELAERVEELREAARALADDARDRQPARQRDAAARAARARPAAGPADGPLRLPRARRAGGVVRGGAQGRRAGGARRGSPRATARCCRSCSSASRPRTPRRRRASRRSTSRICSCRRATCCATTPEIRERERLRFRSIMVDEFQDTNRAAVASSSTCSRDGPTPSCSSSATSSSRSTASATPTSASSASGARRRRSSCR